MLLGGIAYTRAISSHIMHTPLSHFQLVLVCKALTDGARTQPDAAPLGYTGGPSDTYGMYPGAGNKGVAEFL